MSQEHGPLPADLPAALQPGAALPAIALPASDGATISLGQLPANQARAVVVVYPYTGTPGTPDPPGWDGIPGAHGSTPQLLGYERLATAFTGLGFALYGLSAQARDAQQAFATRHALSFALVSDASWILADALELPTFYAGQQRFLSRLTLVIDRGYIRHVFYPVTDPKVDAREVLAWVGASVTYREEAAPVIAGRPQA